RSAALISQKGELVAPMGTQALPLVDARDVGAAAAAIAAAPAAHHGKTWLLTGPEAITYEQVAATLDAALGRPVRYEAVDAHDYEARLRVAGTPGWRAFDLANILLAYRPDDHAVRTGITTLTGRPATPL